MRTLSMRLAGFTSTGAAYRPTTRKRWYGKPKPPSRAILEHNGILHLCTNADLVFRLIPQKQQNGTVRLQQTGILKRRSTLPALWTRVQESRKTRTRLGSGTQR